MQKTTEKDSNYTDLELMDTLTLLESVNQEDISVPISVQKALQQIHTLVDITYDRLSSGGRLFYIGSGTSGRLGIVDASECPPTFGVSPDIVIGIIAGGDKAIRKAQEGAEDNTEAAWQDLKAFNINNKDIVVGISASGTTPYVLGGLQQCKAGSIATGCIVCNTGSPIAATAAYPVEVEVGPEFITGSTRMKAGTAQKLVLNMLTTAVMIKMGHVKGNKMVDMQLSNSKLVDRGTRMLMNLYNWEYDFAQKALLEFGGVRKVMEAVNNRII